MSEKMKEYMRAVFFEDLEGDELLNQMTCEEVREVMSYVGIENQEVAEYTIWPVVQPKPIKSAS